MNSPYIARVPAGEILVTFPADGGVELEGDEQALAQFRHAVAQTIRSGGIAMNPDAMEPYEFMHYCGDALQVIPPPDHEPAPEFEP